MAYLARLDELLHRADRLLDRDGLVDTVLVVEVDVLDVQAPQRAVDRLVHVLGPAVHAARPVLAEDVAELRREHHLVAPVGDRLADELLVVAGLRAVHVGGVEEEDPELERPVNRRDRLRLVGLAVPGRHPHTPEALLRDLEPLSKRPFIHAGRSSISRQRTVAGGSFKVMTRLGCGIVCSSLTGRIAVPIAKNSITWEPQPWLRSCS